jgi:hypothetical protein
MLRYALNAVAIAGGVGALLGMAIGMGFAGLLVTLACS